MIEIHRYIEAGKEKKDKERAVYCHWVHVVRDSSRPPLTYLFDTVLYCTVYNVHSHSSVKVLIVGANDILYTSIWLLYKGTEPTLLDPLIRERCIGVIVRPFNKGKMYWCDC